MRSDLVKSDVAAGATNTLRPLTHSLDYGKEGLAVNATHRTCSIDNCRGKYLAKGLCNKHYIRDRKRESGGHTPIDLPGEEWRSVVGYEGIAEVSNLGRVRSCQREVLHPNLGTQLVRGRIMRPAKFSTGYLYASLNRDGHTERVGVHRLVLEAFVGHAPFDGAHACHYDGDPTNNALSNLRWDTPSANQLDNVRNGTHAQARKTHCSRGHEFTPENTITRERDGRPRRRCRTCERARDNARYRARSAYRPGEDGAL